MSRNASGTYTLPLASVVSGTAILASWANTTLADVATALTDSLSRSGQGAMQAALGLVDGVLATPGLNFSSETGSGLRRAGTNDVRLTVAGADRLRVGVAGALLQGSIPDGGTAVGVILDNSVSLANAAAKLLSIRNAGVEKAYFDKDGNLRVTGTSVSVGATNQEGILNNGSLELVGGNAFVDFKDSSGEDFDARLIKSTGADLTLSGSHLKLAGGDPATTTGFSNTLTAKSIVKAWASIDVAAGPTPSLIDGFNVASVAMGGTSIANDTITVNWQTDFANDNYFTVGFAAGNFDGGYVTMDFDQRAVGSCGYVRKNGGGGAKAWGAGERLMVLAIGSN